MANSAQWIFVRYADNLTANCPVSFVHPMENLYDATGFDSKRIYSVFWSRDENDSPEEMAKRVASIPRYDKSERSGRPGYYPARILEYGGKCNHFSL